MWAPELTASGMVKPWKAALAHVGLEGEKDAVFHALRHTYATRLLRDQVPTGVVQELMGHTNPKTLGRYSQFSTNL